MLLGMKKVSVLAFGLTALALAGCDSDKSNGNPPTNTAPLTITGMSAGGSGTVAVGAQARIMTVNFAEDLSGVVGTPSVTFKALNGAATTTLTAPCALTSTKTLTCSYTVRAQDAGKAADGIQLDSSSVFTGGVRSADGRTLTPSFNDIVKATGINAGNIVFKAGPRF